MLETEKLKLKLLQSTDKLVIDSWNNILLDADNKLASESHVNSMVHFFIWEKSSSYVAGDVVRISSGKSATYYKCTVGGTSGITEPAITVIDSLVTDGTVTWKVCSLGTSTDITASITNWSSNSQYAIGNVVVYKNKLYRCIKGHVSSDFYTELSNWLIICADIAEWSSSTVYAIGDTVLYKDAIYLCTVSNTSSDTFDASLWKNIGGSSINNWASSTAYALNDIVLYNDTIYRCKESNTSSESFSTDATYWECIFANISVWKSGVYYGKDSTVLNNSNLYICLTSHTSSTFDGDKNNWKEIGSYRLEIADWSSNSSYLVGDVCVYNKQIYRCSTAHTSGTAFDATKFDELSPTIDEITVWRSSHNYAINDVITYNHSLYTCKVAHTSSTAFDSDRNNWEVFDAIYTIVSDWSASTYYYENQLTLFSNKVYRCKTSHVSSSEFSTDSAKWDILSYVPTTDIILEDWKSGTLYKSKQLILADNYLWVCSTEHTSLSTFSEDKGSWVALYGKADYPKLPIWESSHEYDEGQIVIYDNVIYRNKTSHTSLGTFVLDTSNWDMVYANITKWASKTYYKLNSVVIEDEFIYFCTTEHTSSDSFSEDKSNWRSIIIPAEDSKSYVVDWEPSILYEVGQLVTNNHYMYVSTTRHTSAETFISDIPNWYCISSCLSVWETGKLYCKGSIVTDSKYVYMVTATYTSGTNISEDVSSGKLLVISGDSNILYWEQNKTYPLNSTIRGVIGNSTYVIHTGSDIYTSSTDVVSDITSTNSKVHLDYIDNKNIYSPNMLVGNNNYFSYSNGISYTRIGSGRDSSNIVPFKSTEVLDLPYATPVNASIAKWSASTLYGKDCMVTNDNLVYRCAVTHTSLASFTTDELSNWYLQSVTPSILNDWKSASYYRANQLVKKDDLLLRVKDTYISGDEYDSTKSDILNIGYLKDWESSKLYHINQLVKEGKTLFRCSTEHTSGTTFDTTENSNWELVSSIGAIVKQWTPNTRYDMDEIALYNDTLYIANETHVSSSTFEADMVIGHEKWRTVIQSSVGEWKQLTKLNATANTSVDIIINTTYTFLAPPIEVLKLKSGTSNVVVNVFTFSSGDGSKFTYAVDYVEFTDVVDLKTSFNIPMSTPTSITDGTTTGYISESDEIDFSNYKSVEGVEIG